MKKIEISRTCSLLFLISIVLLFATYYGASRNLQSASGELEWPSITSQSRPWTRWWWLGNIANKNDLTAEMEKYKSAGLGGLELTPIYGVKGYEDRFISYLSPAFILMLDHVLKEAARLDLRIDMATGSGWPFGGPWIGAGHACRNFAYRTYALKSGERLSESITFLQRPLVRAVGRRLDISALKEPISANENLQSLALDQVRFEKPLPLMVLMAYSDHGDTVNLTDRVSGEGKLDWAAPAGNWTLVAFFQGWHGKMVERAAPGAEGNVIDHFSEEALRSYLGRFDQAFAGRDVRSLRAYFNDSYEVDDALGESNWTPRFFEEFQKRRGYDLRNHLPALLGSDSADKNERILCDYRETLSDLLLDEFTIPWRNWAAGRGAIIRNQAHGSPANILDLYGASDIPETEGADILRFKFASSAAHVTGRQLASSETATWLDEHFTATLADVKQAVDQFFLGGVNHICYHGTPFSPPNEDWPGFLFYASVHFGPTNSFWKDFSTLNGYVARCQSILQSGRPNEDLLVYYPVHDRWSQRGSSMLHHFSGPEGTTSQEVAQALLDGGYAFDFISDRQLGGVEFAGNSLQINGLSYKAVILPETRLMPLRTLEKLVDLARNGATVIAHRSLPTDVPGWGNLVERRAGFDKVATSIRTANVKSGIRGARIGGGDILLGDDLRQLLVHAGVRRETMADHGLRFVRRKHGSGYYYFILNSGGNSLNDWIPLPAGAKSVAIFDPMRDQRGLAVLRGTGRGGSEVYLQLAPRQSCILKTFETVIQGPAFEYLNIKSEPRRITGTWALRFVEGGPVLPAAIETRELRSWTDYGGEDVKRFAGTARYAISFGRPEGDHGWLLDLGRVAESARVRLNGKDLGTLIQPPYRVRIPLDLVRERNALEIDVSNLMANRIADMDRRRVNWKKFYNINFPARRRENAGADGLFDASRWPPRESGLIGPVTVAPIDRATFNR